MDKSYRSLWMCRPLCCLLAEKISVSATSFRSRHMFVGSAFMDMDAPDCAADVGAYVAEYWRCDRPTADPRRREKSNNVAVIDDPVVRAHA